VSNEENKSFHSSLDVENAHLLDMELKGYHFWNDHPGYTIAYLREMLKPHGLTIGVMEEGECLWFRVEKVK
jgi:hypothetical protein